MPLIDGRDAFVLHLVTAQKKGAGSQQEAANLFIQGYVVFIGNSEADGVVIDSSALEDVDALNVFQNGLVRAYKSTSPEEFCEEAEAAIRAYYDECGGAPVLFDGSPAAESFNFPEPLGDFWIPEFQTPPPSAQLAMEKLVDSLIAWKAASEVIFPGPDPHPWE